MAATGVYVEGLNDLRRELEALDLTKDLAAVNVRVAEHVITAARSRASTRLERKAAGTLLAAQSGVAARIRLGGERAPYAAGAEFGAKQFPQFEPWRGNGDTAGYFLYPAIRGETEAIIEMYGEEIDGLTGRAFPERTSSS
jgi:hypothetical protein